jgi:Uma2 family endonuclease
MRNSPCDGKYAMTTLLVHDPQIAAQLIAQRKVQGIDRYDEVWEGVYVLSPLANNEHQSLASQITIAIGTAVDWQGLGRTIAGANISDRREDWLQNYRIPDVLVFQNNTAAEDCGTHWLGGPELAVEIISPGDHTLEKLKFYAQVGTRELLVIDRSPWQLTLYRINSNRELVPAAISRLDQPVAVQSSEFPLGFCLNPTCPSLDVLNSNGTLIRSILIVVRA